MYPPLCLLFLLLLALAATGDRHMIISQPAAYSERVSSPRIHSKNNIRSNNQKRQVQVASEVRGSNGSVIWVTAVRGHSGPFRHRTRRPRYTHDRLNRVENTSTYPKEQSRYGDKISVMIASNARRCFPYFFWAFFHVAHQNSESSILLTCDPRQAEPTVMIMIIIGGTCRVDGGATLVRE